MPRKLKYGREVVVGDRIREQSAKDKPFQTVTKITPNPHSHEFGVMLVDDQGNQDHHWSSPFRVYEVDELTSKPQAANDSLATGELCKINQGYYIEVQWNSDYAQTKYRKQTTPGFNYIQLLTAEECRDLAKRFQAAADLKGSRW